MKEIRLAVMGLAVGLGGFFAATSAHADGMIYPGPAGYVRPLSWTGFYVGGHAGLASGRTQGDPDLGFGPPNLFSTDFDMSGALYGGQVGFNWQTGSTVFGIEGSLSGSSLQGNTTCAVLLECKRNLDWLAMVTGKVGYAWGGSLLYAMGGVAWGDVDTDVSLAGVSILNGGDTHVGWVAGFGFEHAISNSVSLRVEYAHVDLGKSDHDLGGTGGWKCCLTDSVDLKMDTIRLGVNFKFGREPELVRLK